MENAELYQAFRNYSVQNNLTKRVRGDDVDAPDPVENGDLPQLGANNFFRMNRQLPSAT